MVLWKFIWIIQIIKCYKWEKELKSCIKTQWNVNANIHCISSYLNQIESVIIIQEFRHGKNLKKSMILFLLSYKGDGEVKKFIKKGNFRN